MQEQLEEECCPNGISYIDMIKIVLLVSVLFFIIYMSIQYFHKSSTDEEVMQNLQILRQTSRCEKCALSYVNLQGVDLNGAELEKVQLSYADMEQAHLQHADLEWATWMGQTYVVLICCGRI
jgi:hypothetical protein